MKKTEPVVKRKTVTLRIDPELIRHLKHVGVDQGRSLGILVEDAIKSYLKQVKGRRSRP